MADCLLWKSGADRQATTGGPLLLSKAAHACHVLCRSRVVEEMQRRKGTAVAEHLKFVLSVIDGPA